MDDRTFSADGTARQRAQFAVKLLLPWLVVAAANVALGWGGWRSVLSLAVAGCLATFIPLLGRSSWGDRLELLPDALLIHKDGKERVRIAMADISMFSIRPDTVAIAWQDGARRRSIVIGREGFAAPTWEGLCAELRALAVPGVQSPAR